MGKWAFAYYSLLTIYFLYLQLFLCFKFFSIIFEGIILFCNIIKKMSNKEMLDFCNIFMHFFFIISHVLLLLVLCNDIFNVIYFYNNLSGSRNCFALFCLDSFNVCFLVCVFFFLVSLNLKKWLWFDCNFIFIALGFCPFSHYHFRYLLAIVLSHFTNISFLHVPSSFHNYSSGA